VWGIESCCGGPQRLKIISKEKVEETQKRDRRRKPNRIKAEDRLLSRSTQEIVGRRVICKAQPALTCAGNTVVPCLPYRLFLTKMEKRQRTSHCTLELLGRSVVCRPHQCGKQRSQGLPCSKSSNKEQKSIFFDGRLVLRAETRFVTVAWSFYCCFP
jgi:hypothetical protein